VKLSHRGANKNEINVMYRSISLLNDKILLLNAGDNKTTTQHGNINNNFFSFLGKIPTEVKKIIIEFL